MPSGESIVELETCGEVILAVMVLGESLLLFGSQGQEGPGTCSAWHGGDSHAQRSRPFSRIFNNTTLNITQVKNKKHW